MAITRIEQFHPFPFVSLKKNIESYPNLESVVWAQEEHLNAGGWTYVQPRLHVVLKETKYADKIDVTYAGRGPSARYSNHPDSLIISRIVLIVFSVATGNKHQHKHEEEQLLMEALGLAQWDPKDAPKGVQ